MRIELDIEKFLKEDWKGCKGGYECFIAGAHCKVLFVSVLPKPMFVFNVSGETFPCRGNQAERLYKKVERSLKRDTKQLLLPLVDKNLLKGKDND